MPGDKEDTHSSDDLKGLEEATAGWDPYVSDLINSNPTAPREERRTKPRDNTPSRRRAMLASGEDEASNSSN